MFLIKLKKGTCYPVCLKDYIKNKTPKTGLRRKEKVVIPKEVKYVHRIHSYFIDNNEVMTYSFKQMLLWHNLHFESQQNAEFEVLDS